MIKQQILPKQQNGMEKKKERKAKEKESDALFLRLVAMIAAITRRRRNMDTLSITSTSACTLLPNRNLPTFPCV